MDPLEVGSLISAAVVAVVLGVVGGLRMLKNGKTPPPGTDQRAAGYPPPAPSAPAVDPLGDTGRHLAVGPMTGHELRAMAESIGKLAAAAPATSAELTEVEKRIHARIDHVSDSVASTRKDMCERFDSLPCSGEPPAPCPAPMAPIDPE